MCAKMVGQRQVVYNCPKILLNCMWLLVLYFLYYYVIMVDMHFFTLPQFSPVFLSIIHVKFTEGFLFCFVSPNAFSHVKFAIIF